MTVLTGVVVQSAIGRVVNPRISTDVREYGVDYWPRHVTQMGLSPSGALVTAWPVSTTPRALTVVRANSFLNDFYYRIHVTPNPIDLGNVLGDKSIPLLVWNSFFEHETMTAFDVPTDIGGGLTMPAGETLPFDMFPLREAEFTLTAFGSGAPIIDSGITFTIGGVDYLIPVIGKRVVVFPFAPNWNAPFDESFEFKSWVIESANGDEQTGSNWGNQPRHSFDYTILVAGKQVQRLENMLFGWQYQLFGIPHWSEKSKLTGDASVGATIITLDTTDRSFEIDGTAILYLDADNYEAFQIVDMSDSSLEASTPLNRAWPAGTRVYPLYQGLISPSTTGAYQTDAAITMPVSFDCEPSKSPVNTIADAPTLFYRGEELYLGRVNWANALSFNYESDRMQVDYGSGTIHSFSPSGISKLTRKHNWTLRNRTEARAFRAWLGRREGVARPVYMPTGISDFTLAGPAEAVQDVIDVTEAQYATFAAMAPARRDIIILLRDGTYIARRIVNAISLTGDITRLTLDAALGVDITRESIKRMSFLALYRLDGNSVTIRWITDGVGVVETNLKTKNAA